MKRKKQTNKQTNKQKTNTPLYSCALQNGTRDDNRASLSPRTRLNVAVYDGEMDSEQPKSNAQSQQRGAYNPATGFYYAA